MIWNEQTETELKQMWVDGVPFSDMARRFNVTRNTIVGKAHRMGMKGSKGERVFAEPPRDPREYRPLRYKKKRIKAAAKPVQRLRPLQRLVLAAQERQQPAPPPSNVKTGEPVKLEDLNSSHCRYPLWDDRKRQIERFYCGNAKEVERPYCPHHHVIAYPPDQRRIHIGER